uniref:Uncharacterized protein n=1 Tax=Arundo donax TaxID=35708 RepID=A0A0A9C3C0_ARUDO
MIGEECITSVPPQIKVDSKSDAQN